ncbi:MAG: hypothetical protein M3128_08265 [Verrucomicrobiota bacterium]|nr:hypothetical protein [Verrucomicrobiota bacterium]
MINPSEVQEQDRGNVGPVDETQNVDRIRDILFGPQMRDYDARFQKLEERLTLEANNLRWEIQKRLEAMEAFMRGETESLGHRLTSEQNARNQHLEKLGRDLGETAQHVNERLTNLDGQMAKEFRELRQQLLDHSKALSGEIKDKHDQLKAGLDQEAAQIRGAMTGREQLSEMLSELSLRLKGEFRVPIGS